MRNEQVEKIKQYEDAMRDPTTVERIIAAAEVLRREGHDVNVNRVAAVMLEMYEIAHNIGEEPTQVAKGFLMWDVYESF